MRQLKECEEVMLTGLAAAGATLDNFNPYYGLVVHDDYLDSEPDRTVVVLWEDGRERLHPRNCLMAWADAPEGARRS